MELLDELLVALRREHATGAADDRLDGLDDDDDDADAIDDGNGGGSDAAQQQPQPLPPLPPPLPADGDGCTPLHSACSCGHADAARLLLRRHAVILMLRRFMLGVLQSSRAEAYRAQAAAALAGGLTAQGTTAQGAATPAGGAGPGAGTVSEAEASTRHGTRAARPSSSSNSPGSRVYVRSLLRTGTLGSFKASPHACTSGGTSEEASCEAA